MAITPYSTPVEAPVMETYVGLPFQEIQQAGAMKQARYEEGLAAEEAFQTQLDALQGKSSVVEPYTGRTIKLADADVIEKFQSDFRAQIDELAASIPDKSSPEFRSKVRALIGAYRREAGPNGKIGIAQQNIKTIQDFYQRMEDNPQMQKYPHLYAPFIRKMRAHEAQARSGVITPIDLSGAMGEGINIDDELIDKLKYVAATELKDPEIGQYSGNLPGLLVKLQQKGVTQKRIAEITSNLLKSPEIAQDIMMQAEFAQQTGRGVTDEEGNDITANTIANRYVQSMADIFGHVDVDMKTFYDQDYMAKLRKKLDKKQEVVSSYTNPVILPKAGAEFRNASDLSLAMSSSKEAIKTAQTNLDDALAEAGVTERDENGNWILTVQDPVTGNTIDRTDRLQPYFRALSAAIRKEESLEQFDRKLRREAELTDEYFQSPAYNEAVAKAKEDASKEYDKSLGRERGLGASPMAKEDFIARNYKDFISKHDKRYQKYEELLQEETKNRTFVAGVTSVSEDMEETLRNNFTKFFHSPATATGSIKDVDTLEELDLKDYKAPITKESRPDFLGFYMDDAEQGAVKLLYNLKDEDGKFLKRVKIDPPKGFVEDLVANNQVDGAKLVMNSQLMEEAGLLGVERTRDTMVFGDPDAGGISVDIDDKSITKDGRYKIKYTVEDKNAPNKLRDVEIYPRDKGELVRELVAIQLAALQNQLNE